jgi:hypothetical protein
MPSSWRSRGKFVSNSANMPSMSRKHVPAAYPVSIGCSVAFSAAPRPRTARTISCKSPMLRASRSIRRSATGRAGALALSSQRGRLSLGTLNCDRELVFPDTKPAARRVRPLPQRWRRLGQQAIVIRWLSVAAPALTSPWTASRYPVGRRPELALVFAAHGGRPSPRAYSCSEPLGRHHRSVGAFSKNV